MTTPITADDVVAGAVRWLLDQPAAVAAVGASGTPPTPLIVQDVVPTQQEMAQSTAVVVSYAGGWAGANLHNTLRAPRLQVEIWADPIRDGDGAVVEQAETRRRVWAVYKTLDALLHRPQGGLVWWGSVRTINCQRLGEPTLYPVPAGDGMLRGAVFYAVSEG